MTLVTLALVDPNGNNDDEFDYVAMGDLSVGDFCGRHYVTAVDNCKFYKTSWYVCPYISSFLGYDNEYQSNIMVELNVEITV